MCAAGLLFNPSPRLLGCHHSQTLYTNHPRHRALLVTPPRSGAARGIRAVHQDVPKLGPAVMVHASGVFLTMSDAICVKLVRFVQVAVRMNLAPGGIST